MMVDMNKRLVDRDIQVELTSKAKELIGERGFDPAFGARPLKRYLQKNVETLSAKLILSDGVEAGDIIVIDVDEATNELCARAEKK